MEFMPKKPLTKCSGGTQHTSLSLMAMLIEAEEPTDRAWIIAKLARHCGLDIEDLNKAYNSQKH